MMLTDATIFRITDDDYPVSSLSQMNEAFQRRLFVPTQGLRPRSVGWVSPETREYGADDQLITQFGTWPLLCAKIEEKVVPPSAVSDLLIGRLKRFEDMEGRPARLKEARMMRDDVVSELTPRALPRSRYVWGYFGSQYVVVATASSADAELFVDLARDTLAQLPVAVPATGARPADVMTSWMRTGKPPKPFYLLDDCDLVDPEDGSKVSFRKEDLYSPEVRRMTDSGKICSQLRLRYGTDLAFTLNKHLQIKSVKNLSTNNELDDEDPRAAQEAQLTDFALQLERMLRELLPAMGGEQSWLM